MIPVKSIKWFPHRGNNKVPIIQSNSTIYKTKNPFPETPDQLQNLYNINIFAFNSNFHHSSAPPAGEKARGPAALACAAAARRSPYSLE